MISKNICEKTYIKNNSINLTKQRFLSLFILLLFYHKVIILRCIISIFLSRSDSFIASFYRSITSITELSRSDTFIAYFYRSITSITELSQSDKKIDMIQRKSIAMRYNDNLVYPFIAYFYRSITSITELSQSYHLVINR
jgi:hypothetical protein